MDLSRLARHPGLKGRSVFISGGGSGIGAAIVESFVDQGSKVAFVDIDEAKSQKLVADLKAQYGNAPLFIRCDLKDIPALQAAIAKAGKEHGDVTVLVNNGGNDQRHKWEELTPEGWDDRIAVNMKHVFFAMQSVVPQMRHAGGGAIVNFGSVSWKLKQGGMPVYTSSKAAVQGLTRSLARDFGPFNIRVNTLVPGWVMTDKQQRLWLDDKGRAEIARGQCINAPLLPAHIAQMALFLAADDSAMCTAQDFVVDGGWT
jgi:NAD(P)-dependent dehydrogenase (short-subunit alcohol dehydrogenase family)